MEHREQHAAHAGCPDRQGNPSTWPNTRLRNPPPAQTARVDSRNRCAKRDTTSKPRPEGN